MNEREFIIYQLLHDCKVPKEVIDKADEITDTLNEFLESEILIPHPVIGFNEVFGCMRRGHTPYKLSQPETMKKKLSVKSFERQAWPHCFRNGEFPRLEWFLTYEYPPEFQSSGQISMGYVYREQAQPYFLDPHYRAALKEGKVFDSVDELINSLRVQLSVTKYRKKK